VDLRLISENPRGLSAKSAKSGPRVDFTKFQGPLSKISGGGATERGKRGELGPGLTGARAALRRPGDGGAEWGGGGAR
jgi:hypothetical protein